ncbi:hypothetical protein [Priestia megaterium]|uniref:hypothetical protein n=1 Tax=Priestia megaterium TaxID=1404 RepID=UPI001F304405|nr:hypothetical protein [Priestia megaterium]
MISVILYQSVYVADHQFNIQDTITNRQFVNATIELDRRWWQQYGRLQKLENDILLHTQTPPQKA